MALPEQDLEQAICACCQKHCSEGLEDGPEFMSLRRAVQEVQHAVLGSTSTPSAQLKAFLRCRPDKFAIVNRKVGGRNQQFVACFNVSPAAASATPQTQHAEHGGGAATYCGLCRRQCDSPANYSAHVNSSGHRVRQLQRLFRQQGGLHANDAEGGIMVSTPPELQGLLPGETYLQQLMVTNVGTGPQLLVSCSQMRALPEICITRGEGQMLQPGETCTIGISISPTAIGWLRSMVILDFGATCLARLVSASCDVDDPSLPHIGATSEFKRRPRPARVEPATQVVPGVKPPRAKGAWVYPPKSHKMPGHLLGLFEGRQWEQLEAMLRRPVTDAASHADKLTLLLFLEELQQQLDVRQYDMDSVELHSTPGGQLLALEVPGLAENRPSVLRGDALYATPVGEERSGREYQGFVHMVRQLEVLLRFHSSFSGHSMSRNVRVSNLRYNVRFSIKRSTLVFMHEAVALLRGGVLDGSFVLPGAVPARVPLGPAPSVPQLAWVNRSLNEEQQCAVRAVVAGGHAPQPYLIFGPPGTGKTSTLVEAAVQVLRTYPNARLLLAAPSNDAADLLAQRLLRAGRPSSELLRINAYQRPKEAVPPELVDVSTWDDGDGAFRLPLCDEIEKKRVVVVTCLMAAKVHARGVAPGHFSHIMMDEAGHAEEPLALAAMAGLAADGAGAAGTAGACCRVVLAGDPRQLGPIVQSRLAKKYGLDVSLMERLLGRQPYAPQQGGGDYDARFITQLVRNYRSHKALLELPSRLFYDNKLQACADPIITDSLLGWEELPNGRFPLLFHAVVGRDEQEGSSPSWFNVHEAKLVLQYVTKLRERRRNPIAATDIGIITPYRRQVQKVRRLLESKGMSAVKVGSVEEFQGQERRVIIISTVRSNSDLLDTDLKHRLGFVASPKRFNVAITRAQAGVIIIGNPEVLATDAHWRQLLKHASINNACKGAPNVADVLTRVRVAGGDGAGGDGDGEDEMAGVEALLGRLALQPEQQQPQQQHGMWDGYSAVEIEGGAQRRLM